MNQADETKGYQWPASALTDKEMEILYEWREKTGTPICQLLKQSINLCQDVITGEGVRSCYTQ